MEIISDELRKQSVSDEEHSERQVGEVRPGGLKLVPHFAREECWLQEDCHVENQKDLKATLTRRN
jgi:hypothetical protein